MELQDDALKKIELLANPKNHKDLRVHPPHGALKGSFAFSVNFKIRIVFAYADKSKQTAILLAIGDHDVYQ
jgi:plasmid maintenance system killer protein